MEPDASTRPTAVFCTPPTDAARAAVTRRGYDVVHRPMAEFPTARELRAAKILVTTTAVDVDATLLEGAPGLRAVLQASSGCDNVDLDACASRGVRFRAVDPGNANAVAEFTIGSLIALLRAFPQRWKETRTARWPPRVGVTDGELRGREIRLIGLGSVGSRVARLASAFGMRILAYDPYLADERFEELEAERVETLPALFHEASIVSVHCPLNEETRGMIGSAELDSMTAPSWLINTARGPIVRDQALLSALDTGRLRGAAVDVYSREPDAPEDVVTHPRVLATPHMAGHTEESHARRERALVKALEEIIDELA